MKSFKVIASGIIRQSMYDFLSIAYRNYVAILYRFRDIINTRVCISVCDLLLYIINFCYV